MSLSANGITSGDKLDSISSVILQKQQELTNLNDYRIKTLENTILEKNKQIDKERQLYKQLKADFDYNLKLIEGRDEELRQFDQKFVEMRHELKEKDEAVSELQTRMTLLQGQLKQEQAKNNEEHIFYQERIQELKKEIEQSKFQLEERLRNSISEYEAVIRDLKRQLQDKQEDIDRSKREMEQEFQQSLLQREQQDRSLSTTIIDQKAQIDKLHKELEHQRRKANNQIQMLELENENLKKRIDEVKRDYQNHIAEQDSIHSRQQQDMISAYESRLDSLMSELKLAQQTNQKNKELAKQFQLECEDRIRQKDQEVENIKLKVEEKWREKEKEIDNLKNKEWNFSMELKTEKEKSENLRRLLEEKKNEVQGYKDQIRQLLEKENAMKRELYTSQLQYEKDLEQKQEQISIQNDEVIKTLKKSRDDALAEVQDKQKHIQELKLQLRQYSSQIDMLNGQLRLYDEFKKAGLNQVNQPSHAQPQSFHSHSMFSKIEPLKRSSAQQRDMISREIDDELGLGSLRSASPVESFNFDIDADNRSIPRNSEIRNSISNREYHLLKEERDSLRVQVEKLEDQKLQIKEVIASMKKDLENYQNTKDALSDAELLIQQKDIRIRQLESQILSLQSSHTDTELIKQLHDQISLLSEKVERRDDSVVGGIPASEQVTRLNTLMTDLRMDLEEQRSQLIQSQAKMETVTKENISLKSKLKEAAKDLKKVVKEREKLLDISNMLKAQLNKSKMESEPSKKRYTNSPPRERTEDTVRKYSDQIHKLETKIEDLYSNNEALREEIKRLKTKNHSQLSLLHHPAEREDLDVRISSSLRESTGTTAFSSNDRYGDHVIYGEVDDDSIIHSMTSTNNYDLGSSRTKQKLEEVRSSLSLSGRVAPLVDRALELSSTGKQRDHSINHGKSLRIIQKKKAEMVPKRKAVRDTYQ